MIRITLAVAFALISPCAAADPEPPRRSFAESCQLKLRVAGLWDAAPWTFAPEADSGSSSSSGSSGGGGADTMRVVWTHARATCYANHSLLSPEVGALPPSAWRLAGCAPIPEWDFVWRELLANAPLAGRPMWAPAAAGGFGGHGGALVAGDFTTLADRALYVVHLAPWSSQADVAQVELLGRALHACGARRALLHLSDESGALDLGYQLWPFVVRPYYDAALVQKWGPERLLVAPLGYGSGFGGHHPPLDLRGPYNLADHSSRSSSSGSGVVPLAARSFDWAFVGNGAKRGRPAMLQALSEQLPVHARLSSAGFLGRGAVGLGSVARPLLEAAAFCPTPCGYEHPDSFRFAEALEAGCLPLVAACEGDLADPLAPPGSSSTSTSRGAYFRAYARYAEATFGAPPLGPLGCAPINGGHGNRTWSCPTVPAALLWHPGGGGRGGDWPALAAAAAASLEELRRGEYASMREEDPLEAVQRELVAWWRGLKQSAAAEIGRRLSECMA